MRNDRSKLPDQFVLCVGTLEPRKNLDGLMRAHQRLDEDLRRRFPLVIAGPAGWKFAASEAMMRDMIARGHAIRLGFVPSADMPALYHLATILAYPSHYEGFGMPVAEAMAAGLPVLTSNRTALPETAGGAAEFVEPDAIDSIADGLSALLSNEDRRCELAVQGRERSADYTWQRSADALRAALTVVSRPGVAVGGN